MTHRRHPVLAQPFVAVNDMLEWRRKRLNKVMQALTEVPRGKRGMALGTGGQKILDAILAEFRRLGDEISARRRMVQRRLR